jgi:hypothetical protein
VQGEDKLALTVLVLRHLGFVVAKVEMHGDRRAIRPVGIEVGDAGARLLRRLA